MPRVSRSFSSIAPSSHCHPFDTLLRTYSGQAVDLQEATSEPVRSLTASDLAQAGTRTRPGIRVAEYCLVIRQWLCFYGRREAALRGHAVGYVKSVPTPLLINSLLY